VGDELAVGDRLAEIETDKATVDFEMADDGVLAKILLPEGATDIPVGTPMCVMVTDTADVAAFADFVAEGGAPGAEAAPEAAAAPPPPPPAAAPAAAATPAPAAAAPAALPGGSLPAVGGRIYWNPTQGRPRRPQDRMRLFPWTPHTPRSLQISPPPLTLASRHAWPQAGTGPRYDTWIESWDVGKTSLALAPVLRESYPKAFAIVLQLLAP
jgi:hypothetical protein